eukprot:COSAG05_NODE_1802_length_4058_cov_6.537004_3_plen_308_part_00
MWLDPAAAAAVGYAPAGSGAPLSGSFRTSFAWNDNSNGGGSGSADYERASKSAHSLTRSHHSGTSSVSSHGTGTGAGSGGDAAAEEASRARMLRAAAVAAIAAPTESDDEADHRSDEAHPHQQQQGLQVGSVTLAWSSSSNGSGGLADGGGNTSPDYSDAAENCQELHAALDQLSCGEYHAAVQLFEVVLEAHPRSSAAQQVRLERPCHFTACSLPVHCLSGEMNSPYETWDLNFVSLSWVWVLYCTGASPGEKGGGADWARQRRARRIDGRRCLQRQAARRPAPAPRHRRRRRRRHPPPHSPRRRE